MADPSFDLLSLLRLLGPLALAALSAFAFDRMTAARGYLPPGFAARPWRRGLAFLVMTGILYVGVFASLGTIGREAELDPTDTPTPLLFALHALLVVAAVAWYLLGYLGSSLGPRARFRDQLGLTGESLPREVGIGLVVGVAAWVVVLGAALVLGLVLTELVGEEALPQEPPAAIVWIAGLPVLARAAVSVSAGVVEELFFRGLLQPRMGILLSTLLFALAHASYQQPFLLFGVTLLSLIYAVLVRWRRSVVAAMVAHTLFDAVQLLVVIPSVLKLVAAE